MRMAVTFTVAQSSDPVIGPSSVAPDSQGAPDEAISREDRPAATPTADGLVRARPRSRFLAKVPGVRSLAPAGGGVEGEEVEPVRAVPLDDDPSMLQAVLDATRLLVLIVDRGGAVRAANSAF